MQYLGDEWITAADSALAEAWQQVADKGDEQTTIAYSVTGTATSGDDFTPLVGSVTITAGNTTATIDLRALDDTISDTAMPAPAGVEPISSVHSAP